MDFEERLKARALPEWQLYYIDYLKLKRTVKAVATGTASRQDFFKELMEQKDTAAKFLADKGSWCEEYASELEAHVDSLLVKYVESEGTDESKEDLDTEAKRIDYLNARKSLMDFERELELLMEYTDINNHAMANILHRFDGHLVDHVTERLKVPYVQGLLVASRASAFRGDDIAEVLEKTKLNLKRVEALRPSDDRSSVMKAYTVGCFDLFHHGHANLLRSLRDFGRFVVVGIHDDASYFKLKNKETIDNLETRIDRIRPFCDMVFVIPSTDPTPYLRAMISDQDVQNKTCCYVRGDDMPGFPGKEMVESLMPVHLVPRSQGVSSSFVRAVYHGPSKSDADRAKIAFAKLDAVGKPIA